MKKLAFIIFVVIALELPAMSAVAATGVPKIMNYQGRLLDSSGNLLGGSGTTYCFRFSIYDNVTVGSGTKLWPSGTPSSMQVAVKNGVFNVGIGDTLAGGDALTFDFQSTDTAYLNVDVATYSGSCGTFETLGPRQRLESAGYAINASAVGGYTPAQNASGNQIPVLSSGNFILGGTNPQVSATGTNILTLQGAASGNIQFFNASNTITSGGALSLAGNINLGGINPQLNASGVNTLTLQGGSGTGNIQFFNASNTITSAGALTMAGTITGNTLQLAATTNQIVFQSAGVTGTMSWTPTGSAQTLTIPNFGTATDTVATEKFAQTLSNKTLASPNVTGTLTLAQATNFTGFALNQSGAATALAIDNTPGSAQASSTVSIAAGPNVSGDALLVTNNGSGNAFEVRDGATSTLVINSSGQLSFAPGVDSASAFVIKNSGGVGTILSLDTSGNNVKIGDNSAAGTGVTLLTLDTKADAGDPTGVNGAMYFSSSTQHFRCYDNNAWTNCVPNNMDWQPSFIQRRWGYWTTTTTAATAFAPVGMINPVSNGTPTASPQADDYYVNFASANPAGSVAGLSSAFTAVQGRWRPRLATQIRTDSAVTNRRIWFGLFPAAPTALDTSSTMRFVGIRYSTNAGDTTWKCGSGDGTAASFTDTGVTVTASTVYDLVVDWTASGTLVCQVAVNGGAFVSTSKTTNIDATQTAALGIYDSITNITAGIINHLINYVYLGKGA